MQKIKNMTLKEFSKQYTRFANDPSNSKISAISDADNDILRYAILHRTILGSFSQLGDFTVQDLLSGQEDDTANPITDDSIVFHNNPGYVALSSKPNNTFWLCRREGKMYVGSPIPEHLQCCVLSWFNDKATEATSMIVPDEIMNSKFVIIKR